MRKTVSPSEVGFVLNLPLLNVGPDKKICLMVKNLYEYTPVNCHMNEQG